MKVVWTSWSSSHSWATWSTAVWSEPRIEMQLCQRNFWTLNKKSAHAIKTLQEYSMLRVLHFLINKFTPGLSKSNEALFGERCRIFMIAGTAQLPMLCTTNSADWTWHATLLILEQMFVLHLIFPLSIQRMIYCLFRLCASFLSC